MWRLVALGEAEISHHWARAGFAHRVDDFCSAGMVAYRRNRWHADPGLQYRFSYRCGYRAYSKSALRGLQRQLCAGNLQGRPIRVGKTVRASAYQPALAYRITPTVTVGAALEYDRAYDGLAFQTFNGNALYLGPTLQINFSPKILLAAAFMAQVAGHAVGGPARIGPDEF